MCSNAVLSDPFDTRCVVNASVCLRFLLQFQRVNCSILLEETWGGGGVEIFRFLFESISTILDSA